MAMDKTTVERATGLDEPAKAKADAHAAPAHDAPGSSCGDSPGVIPIAQRVGLWVGRTLRVSRFDQDLEQVVVSRLTGTVRPSNYARLTALATQNLHARTMA